MSSSSGNRREVFHVALAEAVENVIDLCTRETRSSHDVISTKTAKEHGGLDVCRLLVSEFRDHLRCNVEGAPGRVLRSRKSLERLSY